MSGKICPTCNKDIGILTLIKSRLPNGIKCPHCNTPVIYKQFPWLLTVAMILLLLALIFTIIPITYSHFEVLGGLAPIARIVFIAGLWLVFEFLLSLYLRGRCTLVAMGNK